MSGSVSTERVLRKEVHLLHLIESLQALESAWRAKGVAESISHRIQARCIQCGITLTGEEVQQLIELDSSNPKPKLRPRLQRVQKGYCARRTCDSYFYEVSFTPAAELDAELVWNKALDSVRGQLYDATPEVSRPWWQAAMTAYSPREVLTVVLALGTIAFLIWWNFRTPSWATRPSGYQLNMKAVPTVLEP